MKTYLEIEAYSQTYKNGGYISNPIEKFYVALDKGYLLTVSDTALRIHFTNIFFKMNKKIEFETILSPKGHSIVNEVTTTDKSKILNAKDFKTKLDKTVANIIKYAK